MQPPAKFEFRQKIADSEGRLAKDRAAHDEIAEATELRLLGELQADAGQTTTALETEKDALQLCVRLKLNPEAGVVEQDLGWISALLDNPKGAQVYYEMGLKMEEDSGNRRAQVNTLENLGNLAFKSGRPNDAFALYNRALEIAREDRNLYGEAEGLRDIANSKMALSLYDEALENLNAALKIYVELKDFKYQAFVYRDLDVLAEMRDDLPLAISNMRKAIDNFHLQQDWPGDADALCRLAVLQLATGDEEASAKTMDEAIRIRREIGDKDGEADDYGHLAKAFELFGKNRRALETFKQSLVGYQNSGNRRWEGETLVYIGSLYGRLGDDRTALQYWDKASRIYSEIQFSSGLAWLMTLSSRALANIGQPDKAIESAKEAIAIWNQLGRRQAIATTLARLGWIYEDLGQFDTARGYFRQVMGFHSLNTTNRGAFYEALRGMGEAEMHLGESDRALVDDLAALASVRGSRSPLLIGDAEGTLMQYWHGRGQLELAAFFGIESVNAFQTVRKGIEGLDNTQQSSFVRSKAQIYHELAEILVQQDRLGEAEQVLDLVKEEELREVVRGDQSIDRRTPLPLSPVQLNAESDLNGSEDRATVVMDLVIEYESLKAKTGRTAEEEARFKSLGQQIEDGNHAISDFFRDTLYPDLVQHVRSEDANALLSREKSDLSMLQSTLKDLGGPVVAVRVILGDEHAWAILVTAETRRRYELPISPAVLKTKILALRDELRTPTSNPTPQLADLYAILVAPMERELDALERSSLGGRTGSTAAPTILWSLDGVLRYLPMAALFDGTRYMVERFNNVLFSPESYGKMVTHSDRGQPMRALAMGLSKEYHGFPALPGVLPELMSVVHDPTIPKSHGPLDGSLLSDQRFTFAALRDRLDGTSRYPVVHIASHFVVQSEPGSEPYLLVGGDETSSSDGYELTLSHLEDSPIGFQGTRLLTLSACSTAKGTTANNGMEIESLGMVAQRKDAEAVLATLWDVNDASTASLMRDFYERWIHNPENGKAEALRRAQVAFLHTTGKAPSIASRRGVLPENADTAGNSHYAHPYYWAPFVLTGNYR